MTTILAPPTTPSSVASTMYHASYNLKSQWEACCAKAMGFDPVTTDLEESDNDGSQPAAKLIQRQHPPQPPPRQFLLLDLIERHPDDDDNVTSLIRDDQPETTSPPLDPWLENAYSINDSLTQVSDMIRKNRRPYVSLPIPSSSSAVTTVLSEEEACILESTVLSFAATTANQIEALREQVSPDNVPWERSQHYAGMVACLLQRLREEIAEPMKVLQKQRARVAWDVYQNPLTCRRVPVPETTTTQTTTQSNKRDYWEEALGDDMAAERNQNVKFVPSTVLEPSPAHQRFLSAYLRREEAAVEGPLERPVSCFQRTRRSDVPRPTPPAPEPKKRKAAAGFFGGKKSSKPALQAAAAAGMPMLHHHHEARSSSRNDADLSFLPPKTEDEDYNNAALQQEAALLTVKLQSDLDSVQKVEQRMTEITTLLSQFSALVAEQQEDIVMIHETAIKSKENVSKGQDMLTDATERTKRSKHYMATVIASMALMLWFFNHVTP